MEFKLHQAETRIAFGALVTVECADVCSIVGDATDEVSGEGGDDGWV